MEAGDCSAEEVDIVDKLRDGSWVDGGFERRERPFRVWMPSGRKRKPVLRCGAGSVAGECRRE